MLQLPGAMQVLKELPSLWEQYIERLSEYMESSEKRYKNHAVTIRRWANTDKKNFMPRCLCLCQQKAREERRYLYDYTFATDNGKRQGFRQAPAFGL